jgi:hypothetical protein
MRIVTMSPGQRIGIICIAFPWRQTPEMTSRKALKLLVQNRADDTHDTKPSPRDTSTIHGMPTITPAGAFDVDFAA